MIPILETPRLLIGHFQAFEAEKVAAYYTRNQDFHGPWSPQRKPSFFSTKYWAARLHAEERQRQLEQSFHFYFCAKPNNDSFEIEAITGQISFTQLVQGCFCACYLGFSIDESEQGQGFMTEALTQCLKHMAIKFNLNRIMANYRPENKKSENLLMNLKFEREGYAKRYLKIDGEWRDHVLTALHRETIERL